MQWTIIIYRCYHTLIDLQLKGISYIFYLINDYTTFSSYKIINIYNNNYKQLK